jgi:hypothetical protein
MPFGRRTFRIADSSPGHTPMARGYCSPAQLEDVRTEGVAGALDRHTRHRLAHCSAQRSTHPARASSTRSRRRTRGTQQLSTAKELRPTHTLALTQHAVWINLAKEFRPQTRASRRCGACSIRFTRPAFSGCDASNQGAVLTGL